jgi:hypothetical protein
VAEVLSQLLAFESANGLGLFRSEDEIGERGRSFGLHARQHMLVDGHRERGRGVAEPFADNFYRHAGSQQEARMAPSSPLAGRRGQALVTRDHCNETVWGVPKARAHPIQEERMISPSGNAPHQACRKGVLANWYTLFWVERSTSSGDPQTPYAARPSAGCWRSSNQKPCDQS